MEKLKNMSKSKCGTFQYDHLVIIDENTSIEYILNLKLKFPNFNIVETSTKDGLKL